MSRTLFAALAVSAVSVLAACGGSGATSPTGPSGSARGIDLSTNGADCADVFAEGAAAPNGTELIPCVDTAKGKQLVMSWKFDYQRCSVYRNDYAWWTSTDMVVHADTTNTATLTEFAALCD